VSLYTLPQIGLARESFNRTVALAKLKGVPSVTPWISLGAAYRPNFCKHDCSTPMFYDVEWNYGAKSNQLGSARRARATAV
jgi:hypothetical protein